MLVPILDVDCIKHNHNYSAYSICHGDVLPVYAYGVAYNLCIVHALDFKNKFECDVIFRRQLLEASLAAKKG